MKNHILAALLALSVASATAQLNAPTDEGAMARAEAMAAEANYQGALDRLQLIDGSVSETMRRDVAYKRALWLYRLGRYADSADAFRLFGREYPDDSRFYLAQKGIADCLYAQGLYGAALEAYAKAYYRGIPTADDAEMAYRRGICALEEGQQSFARASFERAAIYAPLRSAANFYLGKIDFAEGKYADAREHFKNVNTATPPGDMTDYYLASIDFAEGNYRNALAEARRMLRRNGLNRETEAEMNRIAGESLYGESDIDGATDYLRKYISNADTPLPTALYIMGVADFNAGRYEDAVYRFVPVTERGTGALRQSAYLYAGQCFMENGDTEAAILAFDKAAKADDDAGVREAAFYNYAVAKSAGATVPFASASETFEEFLRLYPSGPYTDRVASYLANGYMADHDYERAIARIRLIASPSPKILQAKQRTLYALGLERLREGRLDEAERHLAEAATLSRYSAAIAAEVTLAQARLAQAKGNNDDAAAKYQTYLRMASKDAGNRPVALYGLAYALYGSKKAGRAAEYFGQAAKALSDKSAKADALNRLGDISFAKADFGEAADYYAQAYAASPSTGDYATLASARMKGYMRDYEGKLDALATFCRNFSSSALMPDALLETTQAQISLGRNAQAVETYRTLIADYPQTSQGRQGYLQMAMTLLDMGHKDEAVEAYRAVIKLYPTSDEAVQASSLLKNIYADDGAADKYLSFISSVDKAPAISAGEAEELAYESAVKAFEKRGDTAQLEDFVRKYPSSPDAASSLGMMLDKAEGDGHKADAVKIASAIVAEYPDSRPAERAFKVLAQKAYADGNLPEALRLWQQLEDKASDAATATDARLGIMRTARDMGDLATAGRAADEIIASSAGAPAITEAKFTKASALQAKGDNDAATTLWLEISTDTGNLFGARSAYEAASALHEAGKDKRALDVAQKLTRSGSPHRYWLARAFILISDIYSSQGKKFEAREYLEALRDNYPGNETDIFMMIDSRLADKQEKEQ